MSEPMNPGHAAALLAVDRLGRPPKARIREGLTWPGGTATFRLRVLRVDEVQLSRAAAVRYFVDVLKWKPDALNADEFNEETLVQILARAVEQPDGPAGRGTPLFTSADELREAVERDELEQVWNLYVDLRESTQDDDTVDEDTVERVLSILKKKEEMALRGLAPSTLRALLRIMAARLETHQTGKSSSTSSSSESTPSGEESSESAEVEATAAEP